MNIAASMAYFIVAGLCEIGGGYLIWLWLREGKSLWLGVLGGGILMLYGVIPTLQPANSHESTPPMVGSSHRTLTRVGMAWGWSNPGYPRYRWSNSRTAGEVSAHLLPSMTHS